VAEFGKLFCLFLAMNLADCYRLLGLRTGASFEDIKASYRRLARAYHPDVNPDNPQQAQEKFIQLTEAYKYLLERITPSASPSAPPAASPSTPPPPASPSPKRPPVQPNPDLSQTDQQLKQNAYGQLQQFLREHRFPRAIALVEGLAQRMPQDIEVRQWQAITYQRWGRQLMNDNQLEKARLYLKKALRTDPHNKSLWHEVERDFRRLEQAGKPTAN
jgi:tetratricopeptide (TPR) repeat protein